MKAKKIRLGTVFVLFTVVILCVVVLSVLSMMTARADYNETKKAADHVRVIYENESKGQQWLAQVDHLLQEGDFQSLPQDTTYENGVLSTVIGKDSSQQLAIAIKINQKDKTYEIIRWKNSATWTEDTSHNVWKKGGQ